MWDKGVRKEHNDLGLRFNICFILLVLVTWSL